MHYKRSNPLNKVVPVSLTAPKMIGHHKDCGGVVFYHSGTSYGYRRCSVCGQDGRHGTTSPELTEEANTKLKMLQDENPSVFMR